MIPTSAQRGDDVGVHVEVAEQRAVGGDGGATELLDLRLELLGRGRPGLGVVEGDGSVGVGRRWTWGCSRWRSVVSPLVCWGTGSGSGGPVAPDLSRWVVAGSVPAPTQPAEPGVRENGPGDSPGRASSSGRQRTDTQRARGLADSHRSAAYRLASARRAARDLRHTPGGTPRTDPRALRSCRDAPGRQHRRRRPAGRARLRRADRLRPARRGRPARADAGRPGRARPDGRGRDRPPRAGSPSG